NLVACAGFGLSLQSGQNDSMSDKSASDFLVTPGKPVIQRRHLSRGPQPPPGLFLKWLIRLGNYLSGKSEAHVVGIVVLSLAIIAAVDILTGEVSTSIFYLIPISFTTWRLGRVAGLVTSLISALLWGLVEVNFGLVYPNPLIPVWNAIVRLGFFVIVT